MERKEKLKSAKDLILGNMRTKKNLKKGKIGFAQMTFKKLREDLKKPDWTDEFFGEVIQEFPNELAHGNLETGPGRR